MQKRLFISILLPFLLYDAALYARQKTQGASSPKTSAKPWAVVAGISKYENIRGLNFADKDAQAFYNYLVNTRGGPKLKPAQVKLLLNEKALSTEIYGALYWLEESVKPNDRVIFYFSGHGDVENKSDDPDTQEGFLLAYNAPKAAYKISGAVSVRHLQQYFDKYINQNKAQCVILIADACRSGDLAGGSEGAQLTTQALGKSKNKQIIKILSAQENEVSFEGSKWGGGVFTYYLLKGIEGLANSNNDNVINTAELAAYLPLKVAFATANAQHPHIDGNPQQSLFVFNQQMLNAAKKEKNNPVLASGSLGTGIAEDIAPDIKRLYQQYLDYLQQRKLVWGDDQGDTLNCAKHIYLELLDRPGAKKIQASLKSSFIVALQQTTQESLDNYVKGRNKVYYNINEILCLKALISPDMVLYNYIMARIYFIESEKSQNKRQTIEMIKKALQFEKNAPYALNDLGYIYCDVSMIDSALYCFQKAISAAPQWAAPYVGCGLAYGVGRDYARGIACFQKAIELDSANLEADEDLGQVYQGLGDYNKALIYHKKAVQLDTGYNETTEKQSLVTVYGNIAVDYQNLGEFDLAITNFQMAAQIDSTNSSIFLHLGTINQLRGSYKKAILNYKKVTQLDSASHEAYYNLGLIYEGINDYVHSIAAFKKAIQIDSTDCTSNILLGYRYIVNKNIDQGAPLLKRALKLNPTDQISWYILACAWSDADDTTNSLNCLKKAIESGWQNYDQIMTDDNLADLRKIPEFSQLMKHYFPDKVK
jgi:tetratricopeptide (TPR) repeat protein